MTTTSTGRPEPLIDPRIRDRRREIRRREGRRRLRRLAAVAGAATFVVSGVLVVLSPVLDVDRLAVRGAARTDVAEVGRVSGIEVGAPMATFLASKAAERVETLPWVARARVSRSWPSTVVVTIDERTPAAIAVAGGDGRKVLIDADGRQLAVTGDDGGLPAISGLGFTPAPGVLLGEAASGALELATHLAAAFPDRRLSVVVDAGGALEARITGADGGEVRSLVGEPDRIPAKVLALASVLEQAGRTPPPSVVDVRAPDAPALTRASS